MDRYEEFRKRYAKLNPEQKQAVDTLDGPVMVVAGPGMGKTELLGLRVANILRETDTSPEAILCLTFTDVAARNMQDRLASLIGKDAYKVAVHTFHSFATEVINHNPEYFYDGVEFSPAEPLAQVAILSRVMDELLPDNPLYIPTTGSASKEAKRHRRNSINAVKSAISSIKGEGFLPEEYLEILAENEPVLVELNPVFNALFQKDFRKKQAKLDFIAQLPEVLEMLREVEAKHGNSAFARRGIRRLASVYLQALEKVKVEIAAAEKLTVRPATAFRDQFLERLKTGEYVLKDFQHLPKNRALAQVYAAYREGLHAQQQFDFDDMLIEVNQTLRKDEELAFKYQTKYEYILVDEFQDTNLSQAALLNAVVDVKYSEGRPNVLVVGDDDQAIYKFQGANIENILNFQTRYLATKFITLHRNYRSDQLTLDLAKEVIQECQIRLADRLEITKDLVAASGQAGVIPLHLRYQTRLQQINALAQEVKARLAQGQAPTEIVVLVKKHAQLAEVLKAFGHFRIPVRYDRATNVLEQRYIQEIILLLKFVYSVFSNQTEMADEYMPKILAFQMFGLDSLTIYKISRWAYMENKPYLEIMERYGSEQAYESEKVAKVHRFLLGLAKDAQILNAEQVLDRILGVTKDKVTMADEHDDGPSEEELKNPETGKPLFALKDVIESQPDYLVFLSGMKVFVDNLRAHKAQEVIYIQDVIEYVELLEENDIPLNDTSPYNQDETAVQLMTVHAAKGLEFETVYVLDCLNSVWNRRLGGQKIQLARNTPFMPEPDNNDDFLRAFFVALTRAKKEVRLFSYELTDKGRVERPLEFLVGKEPLEVLNFTKVEPEAQLPVWMSANLSRRVLKHDEKEWLRPFFETYKLSVTNLNNYLDVTNGGPAKYLERNILRFPESKSPSASYGTAIHEAAARGYVEYVKTGRMPPADFLLEIFANKIQTQRLAPKDERDLLHKGLTKLEEFYHRRFRNYPQNMHVEVNFKHQGVRVNGVPLTGAIDQLRLDPVTKTARVVDLKTGKGQGAWSDSRANEYMKTKLDKYKRQLVFYKLLLENSRDWRDYRVETGSLLFVEPHPETDEIYELEHRITPAETAELAALIEVVYHKIKRFDFPDTSDYPATAKGMQQFIKDLLAGRV